MEPSYPCQPLVGEENTHRFQAELALTQSLLERLDNQVGDTVVCKEFQAHQAFVILLPQIPISLAHNPDRR